MTQERQSLGRAGESQAQEYLLGLGYRLLERSYRNRLGEIDLVMQDNDTVVFVEVKTRLSRTYGAAEAAVTVSKQRKLARLALAYVKERGLAHAPLRFDVVAVQDNTVRHIPNAFQVSGYAW